MRATIFLGILGAGLIQCGGKTSSADSGVSSCTQYGTADSTICIESDASQPLEICHHMYDDFIDGGIDATILEQPCAPNTTGCCTYPAEGGTNTWCYYGVAYTPTNVEQGCTSTGGTYVPP